MATRSSDEHVDVRRASKSKHRHFTPPLCAYRASSAFGMDWSVRSTRSGTAKAAVSSRGLSRFSVNANLPSAAASQTAYTPIPRAIMDQSADCPVRSSRCDGFVSRRSVFVPSSFSHLSDPSLL